MLFMANDVIVWLQLYKMLSLLFILSLSFLKK